MNCIQIAELLPEYIRRRLPAEEEAAVRVHLSACPECAEAYEAELAFAQMLRGTDAPAPALLLPQIMASVRVQPQHRPAFRLRPLDVIFALAAAFTLYGMFIGVTALRAIFPFVVDTIDPEALFSGTTGMVLLLTGGCAIVGLAVSLPVAAAVHTMISRERDPLAARS